MYFHQRLQNRLKNFDYSWNGYYFVTICVKNRGCVFGEVRKYRMFINKLGIIVKNCWLDLPNHYRNCFLDTWMIMPNHFHGIARLNDPNVVVVGNGLKPSHTNSSSIVGNGLKPFPTTTMNAKNKIYSLSEIIRGFKTFSSRKINEIQSNFTFKWQKSYYDHIVRDEKYLNKIRLYIQNNPAKWIEDRNNPNNPISLTNKIRRGIISNTN